MKTIKRILAVNLIALAVILVFSGCITPNRLESGGFYSATESSKAMPELFTVDAAYDIAYSGLDIAFKYERDNRLALWKISKEIKRGLDKIRAEAKVIVVDYANARAVYLASPTPAGLDALGEVLYKLQKANAAALVIIQNKQLEI